MNQFVATFMAEARNYIGTEAAKQTIDLGVKFTTETIEKMKAMLFPDETTLELYNQFYHMQGIKSVAAETGSQQSAAEETGSQQSAAAETGSQQSAAANTGASVVALLKRQNYWIATKFGHGKEECSLGVQFPLPYCLRLGVAASTPAENPRLIFMMMYQKATLKALAELTVDSSGKPWFQPSVTISSEYGDLRVSKENHNLVCNAAKKVKSINVEGDLVHKMGANETETDLSVTVTLEDFKGMGFNIGGFGTASVARANGETHGKLSQVGGVISKFHSGIKYWIRADCKTDGSDARCGFGWSTE